MNALILSVVLLSGVAMTVLAQSKLESDTLATADGELKLTFVGHGTIILGFGGKTLHVDPYGSLADYSGLPKADAILITHEHGDHFDPAAIRAIRTPDTIIVMSPGCAGKLDDGRVMKNGDVTTLLGIKVEAVPAYNILHKRDGGKPFHPRGSGNGYILTFGDKRVYVAGDTENTPEMKALTGIDVAFLPMNLPYTMTPEMVADAAKSFRPKILYPYHYGDTDPSRLKELLKEEPGVQLRIRRLR